ALVSSVEFVGGFARLLHPGATEEDIEQAFGYQLLFAHDVPDWLEMLPYHPPEDLRLGDTRVVIYKVNFNQTHDDSRYHVPMGEAALGELDVADHELDALVRAAPASGSYWLGKSSVDFALQHWDAAADAAVHAITAQPPAERARLSGMVGASLFRE